MIENVEDFLLEEANKTETKKVIISERLKDVVFEIRPLNNNDVKKSRSDATSYRNGKQKFDTFKFSEAICLAGCVKPNFRDASWISRSGMLTPSQLLIKTLRPGEIERLYVEISALSGFDEDFEALVDDVKNS